MTTWSTTSIFNNCPARIKSRITLMTIAGMHRHPPWSPYISWLVWRRCFVERKWNVFGAKLHDSRCNTFYTDTIAWLESCAFKPVSTEPNLGFDVLPPMIAVSLDFQSAGVHAATPSGSCLMARMKSAAFCACAAAYTMIVLSSRNCFNQPSR